MHDNLELQSSNICKCIDEPLLTSKEAIMCVTTCLIIGGM